MTRLDALFVQVYILALDLVSRIFFPTDMANLSTPMLSRKTTYDPKRIGLWKVGRTIGTGSSGTLYLGG